MPVLAEVARFNGQSLAEFNRRTLISDLLTTDRDACNLVRPSDNYVVATKMVWQALKSQAVKQDGPIAPPGPDGRVRRVVRGMGVYQAIELLWPDLSDKAIPRAGAAIRRYLTRGANAECKNQNRAHQVAEWWVADDYVNIQLGRPGGVRKPAQLSRSQTRKPEPTKVKVEPSSSTKVEESTEPTIRVPVHELGIFEAPVILGMLRKARDIATEPIEIAVLDHAMAILNAHHESQADTRRELSDLRSTVASMRELLLG